MDTGVQAKRHQGLSYKTLTWICRVEGTRNETLVQSPLSPLLWLETDFYTLATHSHSVCVGGLSQ